MTTLSILTPSFNYAWCLEDALRSVAGASELAPHGWKIEHVVVDDASTDGSGDILEHWTDRITLERRSDNLGQSSALNQSLALSEGEWVGWLNADDFFLPRAFEDVCGALDGDADLVYGDVALVDRSGRFRRLMPEHPFSLRTLRWWGTYLPVGAVFLRRELAAKLGWREDLRLLLDWDLWLRAAESGARFRFLPRPLAAVRRHSGQESQQDRPERLEEKRKVRRDHGLPATPWQWRSLQRLAALDHAARKVVSSGYRRQRRAAALRDRPMRWFDDVDARSTVNCLYRLAYDRPTSRARSG